MPVRSRKSSEAPRRRLRLLQRTHDVTLYLHASLSPRVVLRLLAVCPGCATKSHRKPLLLRNRGLARKLPEHRPGLHGRVPRLLCHGDLLPALRRNSGVRGERATRTGRNEELSNPIKGTLKG